MCATYHHFFRSFRFSIQLERRCSPPRHAFPSSGLVFPRGIRNFLAISYSHNFRKTCHFQVAWPPAPRLYWSAKTLRWLKTKWREAMQLENDKFCRNCVSS